MLGAGFAEAGSTTGPVLTVFPVVAALAVVIAAMLLLVPPERLTWWRARQPTTTRPAFGLLWVDDRPEHNARLLDDLRAQGVRVDVAHTATAALEQLRERDYAMVVSDMSRVDQPDDDVVRRLEQASGAIPVLVFSRYAAHRDSTVTVVSSEAEIKEWLRSVGLLS